MKSVPFIGKVSVAVASAARVTGGMGLLPRTKNVCLESYQRPDPPATPPTPRCSAVSVVCAFCLRGAILSLARDFRRVSTRLNLGRDGSRRDLGTAARVQVGNRGMPGHDIIVVGFSAGGLDALARVVAGLPGDLPASMFVVHHFPPSSVSALPRILERSGSLPAKHAVHGEPFV